MRIARFAVGDEVRYGVVDAGNGSTGPSENGNGAELMIGEISGHPFGPDEIKLTGARYPVADVRLLAPILPSKVVAIGRNYLEHARELGNEPPAEPLIFLKPSTSVIGPGDAIVRPQQLSQRVDFEGELALVFGRLCREVPEARVPEVIFGYTCANDVTARDLQASDGQWTRAKGFDTFCPLGPWIETDVDPSDVQLTTTVNGEVKQDSRTSLLIHPIARLVSYVTSVMTMIPGDVLLTGTPAGVGPLVAGDNVAVQIEGIGTLANRVTDRS